MPPKTKPKLRKPPKGRKKKVEDPDYEVYEPRPKVGTVQEKYRFRTEKIPKEKLENAIYSILTETTESYRCYKDICTQLKEENIPPPIPDCFVRTQYEARSCLLNQDWTNFSRLLYLMVQNEKKNDSDYIICTYKYFLLALLHDPEVKDKDYLEAFLSSVFECKTPADIRNFLREVSTMKKVEFNTKLDTNVQIQTKVKLPDVDMDRINLKHANNVRKLFLGQKRRRSNMHKTKAHKTYKKN